MIWTPAEQGQDITYEVVIVSRQQNTLDGVKRQAHTELDVRLTADERQAHPEVGVRWGQAGDSA